MLWFEILRFGDEFDPLIFNWKDWNIFIYENVLGISSLMVSNHFDNFWRLRFNCCEGAYPYDLALISWS